MRVIVGCEFSQIVCNAFRDRGHEAYSCDILPTGGNPDWHFQEDILELLKRERFDLGIFHPPCTYLSNAGARHLYPKGILNTKRLDSAYEAKRFFLSLWDAPIPKIAIENPVPSTVIGLPPYSQFIQPYYFGDMVQKKTCLWLKGLPPLIGFIRSYHKVESTKIAGNWFNKGGKDRQHNRAKTFQGIANAMAEQWG